MTSEMPVLFRENTGLKLETTLYNNFAVLSNDKFKFVKFKKPIDKTISMLYNEYIKLIER